MTPSPPRAHKTGSSVQRSVGPPSDRPRAGGGQDGSSPSTKDSGVDAATRGPGLTEADLERVRARDPEALAAFFETHFDRVYGIVYRLLGERAAAEDVTQEVFLKVHRAVQHLDPTRDPRPWITAIAYNACRDLWRSSAYRLARRSGSIDSDPTLSARLTQGTNDPERHVLDDERTRLVRQAIDRLPEPLRAAVLLYDYQGLSHQEIAGVMGINHAAARKRYSRALATLGKMLRGSLG